MKSSVRLLAILALAGASAAFAQVYPHRPVEVVVPWPPGQATDLAARMVSERLVPMLGQPLVVDNRPGAGGVIGAEAASQNSAGRLHAARGIERSDVHKPQRAKSSLRSG